MSPFRPFLTCFLCNSGLQLPFEDSGQVDTRRYSTIGPSGKKEMIRKFSYYLPCHNWEFFFPDKGLDDHRVCI